MKLDLNSIIGVLGSGTMGSGIAQLAATHGHKVVIFDSNHEALKKSRGLIEKLLAKDVEKGRLDQLKARGILNRIHFASEGFAGFKGCDLVIEAIIEDLPAKLEAFRNMEEVVGPNTVLATNTSSLSVTSVAAACKNPNRVIGIHFFNPVMLMQLVEVIPGMQTAPEVGPLVVALIDSWKKIPVLAKDTPGFIVNRVARPFYGEALRIYEESIADPATIDWAMREIGGFKMGPFELMDLIGNDVNYKVTESVFAAFYYDPRYRPSLIQKRMVEAGHLGRKTQRGYYSYAEGAPTVAPTQDKTLGEKIFRRIHAMLVNEACEALHLGIATANALDTAMTKGVNYPKGLLSWGDELGADTVLSVLNGLQEEYGEDRYRPSPLLKNRVKSKKPLFGEKE